MEDEIEPVEFIQATDSSMPIQAQQPMQAMPEYDDLELAGFIQPHIQPQVQQQPVIEQPVVQQQPQVPQVVQPAPVVQQPQVVQQPIVEEIAEVKQAFEYFNNAEAAEKMLNANHLNPKDPAHIVLLGRALLLEGARAKDRAETSKQIDELRAQLAELQHQTVEAPRTKQTLDVFSQNVKAAQLSQEQAMVFAPAYAHFVNSGLSAEAAAQKVFGAFKKAPQVQQPRPAIPAGPDIRRSLAATGGGASRGTAQNSSLLQQLMSMERGR